MFEVPTPNSLSMAVLGLKKIDSDSDEFDTNLDIELQDIVNLEQKYGIVLN